METIKVIDLLNKIANGEEVPEEIVYGGTTYYFNKENRTYEEDMYESGAIHSLGEVINIDDELNNLIFVIEDTPKEDKKIEKTNREDISLGASITNEKIRNIDCYIFDKLDEIIDKVNGE